MYSRPLVAFDGSELSRRALTTGIELARRLGITLRTIIVDEGIPPSIAAGAFATSDARVVQDAVAREASWSSTLVEEAKSAALAQGVSIQIEVARGHAVEAIGEAVERHGCDLLIVGLRHHPGLLERLTSRTAQSLTERVGCSVLGVR